MIHNPPFMTEMSVSWPASVVLRPPEEASPGGRESTCFLLRKAPLCYELYVHSLASPFGGGAKEDLMSDVGVFSSRDLRQRGGELFRDAEKGRLAVLTKHGRPALLAVPFDDRLLALGLDRSLALQLFEDGHLTLVRAAKLAGLSAEEFIELLGEEGVPAVDYPAEELADEVDAAL